MTKDLLDLIDKLQKSGEFSQVWQTGVEFFSSYQFTDVNFAIVRKKTCQVVGFHSTMRKDWLEHYLQSGYHECDPWIEHALAHTDDITYCSESRVDLRLTNSEKSNAMFDELGEEGFNSSILVPFHNRLSHYVTGMNIGSDMGRAEFNRSLKCHKHTLTFAATIIQTYLTRAEADDDINDSWFPIANDTPGLTAREIEVLKWIAAGYRIDWIADKLNLAAVTVNFHLSSIKRKLGAKTRDHAVSLAIYYDLIEP